MSSIHTQSNIPSSLNITMLNIEKGAICVQILNESLILQFTLIIAVCCVLHRYESLDIHCWKFFLFIFFIHNNYLILFVFIYEIGFETHWNKLHRRSFISLIKIIIHLVADFKHSLFIFLGYLFLYHHYFISMKDFINQQGVGFFLSTPYFVPCRHGYSFNHFQFQTPFNF